MAKIDVLKYYNNCISQYKDLTATVEDLQKALENNEVTEEQVNNFIPLVESMKNNIETLSYVVYLLNQPRLNFKQIKYHIKNKQLLEYFKQLKLDNESIKLQNDEIIKLIRKGLDTINE